MQTTDSFYFPRRDRAQHDLVRRPGVTACVAVVSRLSTPIQFFFLLFNLARRLRFSRMAKRK